MEDKLALYTLGGMKFSTIITRSDMGVLLKLKVESPSTNPTTGYYLSKRTEFRMRKRHQHFHVDCSTLHDSQEMETT